MYKTKDKNNINESILSSEIKCAVIDAQNESIDCEDSDSFDYFECELIFCESIVNVYDELNYFNEKLCQALNINNIYLPDQSGNENDFK